MTTERRSRKGKLGREFALSSRKISTKTIGEGFNKGYQNKLKKWEPKKKIKLYKV